jgi:hypothetical protein
MEVETVGIEPTSATAQKDGIYERSRRSVSRPPLANAGGVAGGQPLKMSPDRLRRTSRGEPAN